MTHLPLTDGAERQLSHDQNISKWHSISLRIGLQVRLKFLALIDRISQEWATVDSTQTIRRNDWDPFELVYEWCVLHPDIPNPLGLDSRWDSINTRTCRPSALGNPLERVDRGYTVIQASHTACERSQWRQVDRRAHRVGAAHCVQSMTQLDVSETEKKNVLHTSLRSILWSANWAYC